MHISLNGQATDVAEQCNIHELLKQLGMTNQRLAVEVNQEIVPRSRFAEFSLKAGDKVEIVRAVGGG
jgi:sulfur carrier protein